MALGPDSAFALLVDELDRLGRHECTPDRVVRLLYSLAAGQRIYVPVVDKQERLRFARRQLGLGVTRGELVQRLRTRYQVSEATGYRIINRALSVSAAEASGHAQRRPATQASPRQGAQRGASA